MRKHSWSFLVAVVLMSLFFAQAVGNLSAQSPIVDEPSHIARAMAYWRVGDLRLQLGHPPLIHALAGLPLLLEPSVPHVASLPGWQEPFDRETLNRHALWDLERATDRIVFLARWPVLMLGVLLGALILRWASERFGLWAALVALFLFSFDPNLLAHSVVITTDLGVTFFIVLAVYSFDRWMRWRSRQWLIAAGITLGLALAAKFSAVILLPTLIALGLVAGGRERQLGKAVIALGVIFAVSATVVWSTYRFEVGQPETVRVIVPAPKFVDGVMRIRERDEEGRMAFLLGKMSPRGWWYYFPVAFAVKTPLPTLFLLGAPTLGGIVSAYHLGKRLNFKELGEQTWGTLGLILFPVLYFGVSLRSSLNIGYRHILPILPFLFICISGFVQSFRISGFRPLASDLRPPLLRFDIGYLMLGLWLILEAVLIYPYHLTYFNEMAGGPDNGYKILADSNVDWGQDVKRLKAWLDAHKIGQAYLSLAIGSEPERYGIHALSLPGPYQSPDEYGFQRFAPAPGIYVIGASAWQGLRFHNPDTYDWFRRQAPIARIGHSLFVYQVIPAQVTEKWAAVCYAPDGPIDGDGLAAGFGRSDMRSIYFDCRDGWVYLHDGGLGYYVVPIRGEPTIADEMLLGHGTAVYRDRGDPTQPKEYPGFTLYRWNGEAAVRARLAALSKPPGGVSEFSPAALIGYELVPGPFAAGSAISLTTWWRANEPGEVNLSVYAHVMRGDHLVVNGERSGLQQPQMWQPGDLIVQRHTLRLPVDLPPGDYTLHVGLYSVGTGRRYPFLVNGQPANEHPLLMALHVGAK